MRKTKQIRTSLLLGLSMTTALVATASAQGTDAPGSSTGRTLQELTSPGLTSQTKISPAAAEQALARSVAAWLGPEWKTEARYLAQNGDLVVFGDIFLTRGSLTLAASGAAQSAAGDRILMENILLTRQRPNDGEGQPLAEAETLRLTGPGWQDTACSSSSESHGAPAEIASTLDLRNILVHAPTGLQDTTGAGLGEARIERITGSKNLSLDEKICTEGGELLLDSYQIANGTEKLELRRAEISWSADEKPAARVADGMTPEVAEEANPAGPSQTPDAMLNETPQVKGVFRAQDLTLTTDRGLPKTYGAGAIFGEIMLDAAILDEAALDLSQGLDASALFSLFHQAEITLESVDMDLSTFLPEGMMSSHFQGNMTIEAEHKPDRIAVTMQASFPEVLEVSGNLALQGAFRTEELRNALALSSLEGAGLEISAPGLMADLKKHIDGPIAATIAERMRWKAKDLPLPMTSLDAEIGAIEAWMQTVEEGGRASVTLAPAAPVNLAFVGAAMMFSTARAWDMLGLMSERTEASQEANEPPPPIL